ncbi:zinc finger BED domain-containing protein RICESLEEPER 2-like [Raphanus sativus]|nr:zinc finger BED domain-containing protein RICESLEEPER 2-like [Raphanus sativus]
MASNSDSEEQFTCDTDYSPPKTLDFASQGTLAALAAVEEITDQRIEPGVTDFASGGKKRGSKRKVISLNDDSDDSDVEITPQPQRSNLRRQSSFGTATGKPMMQSTIDGGIGSSSQTCRKEKYVPLKAVIRGGRRKPLTQSQKGKAKASQSPKKKATPTPSQRKKKIEVIPDFDDELDEEECDEDEIGEEERAERQRSNVWADFKVVHKPNGKMKAACNHCRNEYAWHSHSHGTRIEETSNNSISRGK